ncbi:hypothetical protein ACVV37_20040 [Escherichia coli]
MNPGDIVFGDRDGLLIIPQVVEKEVITRPWKKWQLKVKCAKPSVMA